MEVKKSKILKAKLTTGEIITIGVSSNKFNNHIDNSLYEYVGTGYHLNSIDGMKQGEICYLWVNKINYALENLKKGDKLLIYLQSAKDGSGHCMGAGIHGNPDYLTWVVFGGTIGNTSAGHVYLMNGTPSGLPIHSSDVVYVEEGNTGYSLIKSIMCNYAITLGGLHMKNYVDEFHEIPLKKGDYITAGHNYSKDNAALGIRNSHRIINSGDLIYDSWVPGYDYITVKSVGMNKTAFLAINSINVKKTM